MSTPDINKHRLRRDSKPSPPVQESSKRFIMSSPTCPETSKSPSINVDPSVIRHAPIKAGLSSFDHLPPSKSISQPITCTLSQSDVTRIALELKQMLHSEIDYTIKATIDQYKQEINTLTNENQKLRDDLDSLEQYGRRDLMRINGIPDGGNTETSDKTTELVTTLIKSIDRELQPGDIIRSHRIGSAPLTINSSENGNHVQSKTPRQIIVRLKDPQVKKRILRCKKLLKNRRDMKYVKLNEDLTKTRNNIAYKVRQLKIERIIKDTWTNDGKIMVKDNQEQIHVVNTQESFDQFCTNFCMPGVFDFLHRLEMNSKERHHNKESTKGPKYRTYAQSVSSAASNNQSTSSDDRQDGS
ncbi:unnamed protein product [Mytilus edulis]|uniref:Uncharacterized protein n=1 Tax=Mytilus edulis TaxID=6550 RepID=A0A8S3V194_MYTED|nr:unnamed protein product [Mytilus edulis]